MEKVIKINEDDLLNIVKSVVQEQLKKGNINPKNLKFGSGGKKNPGQVVDVKALQQKLMDLKLLTTKSGKPTGYFGSLTDAALKRYNGASGNNPSASEKTPVKNTNPWDINSYPSCVQKFGKPQSSALNMANLFNTMRFGGHQILGTGFYKGYFFTNDGKYFSITNNKPGTYRCSSDGKIMLDIADKANNPNTLKSGKYQYSPRVDAELTHIKNKKMDDTPFFIYDPKDNLIFLFDVGGKYIAKSSVVDGGDAQKELDSHQAFTTEDWCKINGLESTPHFCTNKETKLKQDPYMGPIEKVASRFLPKGIYTIKGLAFKEGYAGKGKNIFGLSPIELEGTITNSMKKGLSAAIHGVPNIEARLKPSRKLQSLLQSDLDNGKVPSKYINDIKSIVAANQSYGCVGIPASFVDLPQVQSIVKKPGVKVFAMGEGNDLLAKNNVGDDEQLVAESEIKKIIIDAIIDFKSKV